MRIISEIFEEYRNLEKEGLFSKERSDRILYLMADLIRLATTEGPEKSKAYSIIMEGTEKEFCSLRDEVSNILKNKKA